MRAQVQIPATCVAWTSQGFGPSTQEVLCSMGDPASRWEVIKQDTQQPPLASVYAQVSTLSHIHIQTRKVPDMQASVRNIYIHVSLSTVTYNTNLKGCSTGVKKKCLPVSTDRRHLAKTTQPPADPLYSEVTVPSQCSGTTQAL